MLNRLPILVAEDEPFIAIDIELAVEDVGGLVVGPAISVKQALMLLDMHEVAGAILDVNLMDRDIAPVVERLKERNVPMILQSGIGLPKAIAEKFPDLVVRTKPVPASQLVADLEALLTKSGALKASTAESSTVVM